MMNFHQISFYCTILNILQESVSNSLGDAQNKNNLSESDDELQERQLQKAIQMSLENFRERCGMESSESTSSTAGNDKAFAEESKQSSSQIAQNEEIRRRRENFLRRFEK